MRCVAVFPLGGLTEQMRARLAEGLSQGAVLALGGEDPSCGDDMPGAYRRVEDTGEVIRLCLREGIPLEETLVVWDDAETYLLPRGRGLDKLPRRVIDKIRREIRQRPMDAAKLSRVSAAEKRRLLSACRKADKGGKRLLIASQMAAFDKGSCAYVQQLLREIPDWSVLHLSETPALSHRILREKLGHPYHRARWAAFPAGYPLKVTGSLPEGTSLSPAAYNLSRRFPELEETGAQALAAYLTDLFALALDAYKPHAVMMWNAFTASHMILDQLARERGIPVIYMEFGVLPGTMNFDLRGQMGQSAIAHEAPVTVPASARDGAQALTSYIANRRMNRNAQHTDAPGSQVHLPRDGRRVITFIGQNDYESGICPWDETARREHSPWYASSMDALRDLAPVCDQLGCRLVYRPHPAMRVEASALPEGVTLAAGGDLFSLLDKSDLTVTLMSQVAYEALLHERNVLMLGRCQLTGKGCAWERGAEESLLCAVSRALAGGYTDAMKEAFLHHVAHAVQDWLYDDLSPRDRRYGRIPADWAALLKETALP